MDAQFIGAIVVLFVALSCVCAFVVKPWYQTSWKIKHFIQGAGISTAVCVFFWAEATILNRLLK